jgi:hypothetical protein
MVYMENDLPRYVLYIDNKPPDINPYHRNDYHIEPIYGLNRNRPTDINKSRDILQHLSLLTIKKQSCIRKFHSID